MLKVKKLVENAIVPTVAHPGDDLGIDLYASANTTIPAGKIAKVNTGIAVEMTNMKVGFLICDRSSMASKGLHVIGGVVDAGYRGEIIVLLMNVASDSVPYIITAGDKIAQMIPIPTLTRVLVQEVDTLEDSVRGEKGFGSTDNKSNIIIPTPQVANAKLHI